MNVFDNVVGSEHIVAESSELKATIAGHIYNLKAIADTDNGTIVARGAWDTTTPDGEVFLAAEYEAGDTPLLVLSVPTGYSGLKGRSAEKYFYNATGEIMRAYELCEGDIFTVSAAAITPIASATGPVVGNYVAVDDGLYAEDDEAGATGFVGQIIAKVNYANSVSYRILVVSTGA